MSFMTTAFLVIVGFVLGYMIAMSRRTKTDKALYDRAYELEYENKHLRATLADVKARFGTASAKPASSVATKKPWKIRSTKEH